MTDEKSREDKVIDDLTKVAIEEDESLDIKSKPAPQNMSGRPLKRPPGNYA